MSIQIEALNKLYRKERIGQERKVMRRVFTGTRLAAQDYKNIMNRIFSNKFRDGGAIDEGDRFYMVRQDSINKGMFAVFEVRTGNYVV